MYEKQTKEKKDAITMLKREHVLMLITFYNN